MTVEAHEVHFEGEKPCILSRNDVIFDIDTTQCGKFHYPVQVPEGYEFKQTDEDYIPISDLLKNGACTCTDGICVIEISIK